MINKVSYVAWHRMAGLATKQIGKYSVYVNNGLQFDKYDEDIWYFVQSEINKLYDEKTALDYRTCLVHGGLFFFDTEKECYDFYRIFEQELTNSSAIYACTYNPSGECETENT